jgi:hypothetical protein
MKIALLTVFTLALLCSLVTILLAEKTSTTKPAALSVPKKWQYSAPLVSPEKRDKEPSHAQKDPTIVFHENRWHLFMTVKLQTRTAIEYCSFDKWENANAAPRTLLNLHDDSKYVAAPQVFYFTPHKKWYLVYQVGVPTAKKFMWVAHSTTETIADPASWSKAKPILDGSDKDPRTEGGLDYWSIADDKNVYLFYTNLKGKLWRLHTPLADFPNNFANPTVALQGPFYEASHTYKIKNQNAYVTLIEQDGKRHYKAYTTSSLDGQWSPLADTEKNPFAGAANIQPAPGVEPWTDNISHGELIRDSNDQTLTIDPDNLQFLFQGTLEKDKPNKNYGQFHWRLGLLTPLVATP